MMADLGELRLDPDPAGIWRLRPVATTHTERQFLYALHRAAMGPYVTMIFGWDEAVQLGLHNRWFDRLQQQPDGQAVWTWIIAAGGEDVGVVQICAEADHLYLSRVEVLPVCQGCGVGSGVIRALQALAARQGRPVRLHVFEINPARRLYERLAVLRQVDSHMASRSRRLAVGQTLTRANRNGWSGRAVLLGLLFPQVKEM
jgi:GNAT superfamily N-acetyltransferase